MIKFNKTPFFMFALPVVIACSGCSKKADNDTAETTANTNTTTTDGTDSGTDGATDGDTSSHNVSITAGSLAISSAALLGFTTAAETYDGIGTNYSEVIVDSFKIKLSGFSVGTGVYGTQAATTKSLVDWSSEPKELEIKAGFDGKISAEADLDAGSYDWLQVNYTADYGLKAYAYFDRDNDGTPDWTLYTTATQLKLAEGQLDLAATTDYDYLVYPGDTNGWNGTITVPSEPFVVAEGTPLSIDLKIDTYHAFKAWDGRLSDNAPNPPAVGVAHDPAIAPWPGFPFNSAQVGTPAETSKPYHIGTPAIARLYIPMFVTAGAANATYTSETYLMADVTDYTPYNTTVLTIVIDSTGKPVIGQANGGDGDQHLHIGPAAKHFEASDAGGFNFYTGGATGNGKPEWNDGGFYYSSDITKASHQVLGFTRLSAVDSTGTVNLGNATRCDDEYNYCVADGSNNKSADNGATKTLQIKRVR